MKLGDQQKVFAQLLPRLIDYIFSSGYSCTMGDCYRDGRVSYGHPNSMHKKRLAVDLNLFGPDGTYLTDSNDYRFLGVYWESLHPSNKWGGEEDGNHFSSYAEDHGMIF